MVTANNSFWCRKCRKDFPELPSVIMKGSDETERFVTECPRCKTTLYRYITLKKEDPYFYESERVKIERQRFAKDLIQYGEEGFQTLYAKEWLKIEKSKEEYEKNVKKEQENRDRLYKKYKYDINKKQVLDKVYG